MNFYWPMGVTKEGEVQSTYDSCISLEKAEKCFRTWEDGYGMEFIAKWIDVQVDDKTNEYRIWIKEFKPKKIYFDMDGVLVDFMGGVKKYLNLEPRPQGFHPDYDNKLFDAIRKETHFYLKLDPIEGSIEMVQKAIDKHGIENIEILTGVPKPTRNIPEAAEDKMKWVSSHISPDIKVNTVLRKDKVKFVTDEYSVLIDDYEANAREWGKAGGTAILFKDYKDPNNKVLEYLGVI